MKKEGFVLVFTDPTVPRDGVICTGSSVRNLKDVVEYFDKRKIKWEAGHRDVFGRAVVLGDIEDNMENFYASPFYSIYQVKPPKRWKLWRG